MVSKVIQVDLESSVPLGRLDRPDSREIPDRPALLVTLDWLVLEDKSEIPDVLDHRVVLVSFELSNFYVECLLGQMGQPGPAGFTGENKLDLVIF